MKRVSLLLFSTLLLAMLLAGCGSSDSSMASAAAAGGGDGTTVGAASAAASGELVLTVEELAQYNGKNGMPAYVAVEGIIYDVTNVPEWAGGEHNGIEAGQDVTDAIKNQSPHGLSVLDDLPIVGKLADS